MKNRKKVLNTLKRLIEYEQPLDRQWIEKKLAKWLLSKRTRSLYSTPSSAIGKATKDMLEYADESILSNFSSHKKGDTITFRRPVPFTVDQTEPIKADFNDIPKTGPREKFRTQALNMTMEEAVALDKKVEENHQKMSVEIEGMISCLQGIPSGKYIPTGNLVTDLTRYLANHEADIAHDINDFGDLSAIFITLFGKPADK